LANPLFKYQFFQHKRVHFILFKQFGEVKCIDVSKEKSNVFILKPYGEILSSPFEILHTEKEMSELVTMLKRFDEEVRVVM
jgi:hypothetical protein